MLKAKASQRLQAAPSTPNTEPRQWCPHEPTERQAAFLDCPNLEALYGGAAGGGKSDALLMAALQYVEHPRYRAVIFRRTYPQLAASDGLIERSKEWLGGSGARWSETQSKWTFPSGATLVFRHLQHEVSKYDHQGAAYHYAGFDELTQFLESQYRYLIGRVRRNAGDEDLPLRIRSASNPGGVGHEWVKQRFLVEGVSGGRAFVPARLEDNPHLDRDEYVKGLQELHPLEYEQLRKGNWDALPSGGFFQRTWFQVVEPESVPADCSWLRFWDMAATEEAPGKDPDWTAGALVGLKDGVWYVKHIERFRAGPGETEERIRQIAAIDGRQVSIHMEQEPGSSGKTVIDHYARRALVGYTFQGIRATGDKVVRAKPVAAAANNGNVKLVRGDWITAFLDEAAQFPLGSHDDQVDAVSGALAELHSGVIKATPGQRESRKHLRSVNRHY